VDDEWDLDGLVLEVGNLWPNDVAVADLADAATTDELYDRIMGRATGFYEQREQELGPDVMRKLERQMMLRILDQRWREHLYEMDYLRDGIGLRAMGQKDPLTEYQREGFDMFGEMMHAVAEDFVKYLLHAQVVAEQPAAAGGAPPAAPADEPPAVSNVQYSAPADPSESQGLAGTAAARAGGAIVAPTAGTATQEAPAVNTPVVKSEWDKTPRNAPCPCGSGKKFKLCHGR
jgi:preprotein translocase subunit SecA